jgi:hypothetical protein
MIVFTSFFGSKKSLLYHFYLAHYKLVLGYYQDLIIEEKYPIATISLKFINIIQDFFAPFYRFVNANYAVKYAFIDDVNITSEIILESSAEIKILGFKSKAFQYSTNLKSNKLNEFISIADASKKLNLSTHTITKSCNKIIKHTRKDKFIFIFG